MSAGRNSSLSRFTARRIAACLIAVSIFAALTHAQSQPTNPAKQTSSAVQNISPVTTTVVVRGEVNGNYLPEQLTVGTLGGEPLKNAPISATVITLDVLNDQTGAAAFRRGEERRLS